jgi:hypothetical protein
MTATITPKPDAFSLARMDPKERLEDYKSALEHYLGALKRGSIDRLVFAENSDSDLEPLRELVRKAKLQARVDFYSHYGLDYPAEYSRGYGEFLLVDRVMASPLFEGTHPDSTIWKVTGRYRVLNLDRLVRDRPETFDVYCHCRNFPYRLVEQYLIAWRFSAYEKHLKGIYEQFKESEQKRFGEQVMRDLFDREALGPINLIPRFAHLPRVQGVRGWDNQAYSEGLINRLKQLAREITHRATPWLWI